MRILKWRARKLARRLWSLSCSRLYRDRDRDLRHSLLIAGTARAGTTWLADLLATHMRSRLMFEPFHSRKVSEYRNFHYFQYMRPEAESEALRRFCQRVFTGEVRDPWIDRQVSTLRPSGRIIKEIRANLLLRWIHRQFPELPFLFIVRHPCAVVASRMQLDWDTDRDIESYLAQPELRDDHLDEHLQTIERARTVEEKHAVIWSVAHLVPFRQFASDELPLIFYEDLCTRPVAEISRLVPQRATEGSKSGLAELAARPSPTTTSRSAIVTGADRTDAWRRRLSSEQIARILAVVEAFGLDHLYGDQTMPRTRSHRRPG